MIFRKFAPAGRESIGWGFIGASAVAGNEMLPAVQDQPPIAESGGIASSWVVGVYSRNETRARAFAHATSTPRVFASMAELCQHQAVDVVYISAVPERQATAVQAALDAGKHVLCEVPLGLSLRTARALTESARAAGLLLGVNYAYRTEPAMREAGRLIREGAIGELMGARLGNAGLLPVRQRTWRLGPDVGVVLDRTIHSLDLTRHLFQDEIAQVTALAARPVLAEEAEDCVMTTVRLRRTGLLVQLFDSYVTPHRGSSLELYGAGGTLLVHQWADPAPSQLSLIRHERLESLPVEHSSRFLLAVYAFNAAVRLAQNGAEAQAQARLPTSGATGVRNLEAALAVRRSIRAGEAVAL